MTMWISLIFFTYFELVEGKHRSKYFTIVQ